MSKHRAINKNFLDRTNFKKFNNSIFLYFPMFTSCLDYFSHFGVKNIIFTKSNSVMHKSYKWQSAILPRGSIHLGKYAEKLSLKLISILISILRKDNIYGACPCIISKLHSIFIITMGLCLLTENFHLIETLIKLHLI